MSRSTRRKPATTDRASTTMKAIPGGMRDELLEFIGERLQKMHQVQTVEKGEMGRERAWFRALARGANGYFRPEPTRWHEAAQLFKGGRAVPGSR